MKNKTETSFKKKILLTIAISIVLSPTLSIGQETVDIKQRLEQVKEKRENLKEKIREEKEKTEKTPQSLELKSQTKNTIEQRVGKQLDEKRISIANGFEKVVENLKDLLLRVEDRISNIENKNSISSTTRELVSKAKNDILMAEEELFVFENKLSATTSTSTKKIYIEDLKIQSEETKEKIKTAHKTIIDIINSLKQGLLNATSTENDINKD